MKRTVPLLSLLLVVVLALAACGGGDDKDSSSGAGTLDAAALQKNLEAKGYGLATSTAKQRPASLGSFAVDPSAGFKSSHYVTGKGLKEADGLSVEGVVTILLFDSADNAKKAFDGLGGETLNRKLVGNRIYLWGGGTSQTKPSPQFQPVIDASAGTT